MLELLAAALLLLILLHLMDRVVAVDERFCRIILHRGLNSGAEFIDVLVSQPGLAKFVLFGHFAAPLPDRWLDFVGSLSRRIYLVPLRNGGIGQHRLSLKPVEL